MKVHRVFNNVNISKSVITTGSFDGVHVGHKVILNRLIQRASEKNAESVLITFYPHPRKVLYPDTEGKDLKMINSQNEKIAFLEETGLDHLIIVEFTVDFSRISSGQFVKNYLVDRLNACHVIIGFNHHFGHNRSGYLDILTQLGKECGFEVEEIPEQDIQNESVSSTKIRKALFEGYIQRANAYLDRSYSFFGKPCRMENAEQIFCIRISDVDKLIPPSSVYAASFLHEGVRQKAVVWLEEQGEEGILWFYPDVSVSKNISEDLRMQFHKRIGDEVVEGLPCTESVEKNVEIIRELIY